MFRLLILFAFLTSSATLFAQSDYEMSSSRLALGLDAKIFIKKIGFVPGLTARYSFTNNNGDENCFSASYFTTNKFKDNVHLQARVTGTLPAAFDTTISYNASFFSLMYHYHYYIQETKYDDDYGFYLAGAAGITKMQYTHTNNLPDSRYITPYSYRESKVTLCLQAAYGVHYQFWSNMRVIGEGGLYYFYDNQAAQLNENPHYISFQLMGGIVFGLGSKNGF